MKFDLYQKHRAKELVLSENLLVWPHCRGNGVKACSIASHWMANICDSKCILADILCRNMSS